MYSIVCYLVQLCATCTTLVLIICLFQLRDLLNYMKDFTSFILHGELFEIIDKDLVRLLSLIVIIANFDFIY